MTWAQNQDGFSLLEVLIAAAMIGVLALVVSEFYSDRLIDYARNLTQTILQSNTKQAIETMERDIKVSQATEVANITADPHASTSTPCPITPVQWCGGASILVLAVPARDAANNPLWIDGTHSAVWDNEIIYYVANNILYKRLLRNPVAPANNTMQTTCTVNGTTPSCAGEPPDAVVIEDVASLVLAYYDRTNPTPLGVGGINSANSVQTSLQQSRTVFRRTFTSNLTSRVYLRN